MHTLELSDRTYDKAVRQAEAFGFDSVDAYVADIVDRDAREREAVESMFTAERLAEIDSAIADVRAGRFVTPDQMEAQLAATREEWLRENSR